MIKSDSEKSHVSMGRVFRSGSILALSSLLSRIINLAWMMIVARWIGPAEMGVFAVAILVLTALEQLTETGLRPALIQCQSNIELYTIPVRTVQAIRGLILGGVVFFSAPWISNFFESPKSLPILQAIAFLPVIQGLEPLFDTLARKELKFATIAVVQITSAVISVVVGMLSAIWYKDAWVLLHASYARVLVLTVCGYLFSDTRNWGFTLNFKVLKQLSNFGFWAFACYILAFVFLKGGDWIIGRLLDLKTLALFQMSFLITTMITSELGGILSQLTLPIFSKLRENRKKFYETLQFSFGTISICVFLFASLIVVCSEDAYSLFLGREWVYSVRFVPWLAVWAVCSVLGGTLNGIIFSLGNPKPLALILFGGVIIYAFAIIPMVKAFGAVGVAMLLAFVGVVMQVFRYWVVANMLEVKSVSLMSHIRLPFLASVVAILLSIGIRSAFGNLSNIQGLTLGIITVFLAYGVSLFVARNRLQPNPVELLNRLRVAIKSAS